MNKRVTGNEEIKKLVYHMKAENFILNEWTVAEYIGLVDHGWIWLERQKKTLIRKTKGYFGEYGLEIDTSKQLKSLTKLQIYIVDLIKAVSRNVRVLVIEDHFEGMSLEDIEVFYKILHRVMEKHEMTVIFNEGSSRIMMHFPDKYIFFRDGRVTKKCRREQICSDEQIDIFLLGKTRNSRKRELDAYVYREEMNHLDSSENVYCIYNLRLKNGENMYFNFCKGKVTAFLSLDDTERKHLFKVLSGREKDRDMYWIVNNQRLSSDNIRNFVRHKVVSVEQLGSREEGFWNMTVGENLILPSLCKIRSIDYILYARNLIKSVIKKERGGNKNIEAGLSVKAGDTEVNDYIAMLLERWLLFNPQVLILLEPFAQCDVYGVSMVKSYIRRFTERGASVIIIKSKEEYIEDISDEIVNLN